MAWGERQNCLDGKNGVRRKKELRRGQEWLEARDRIALWQKQREARDTRASRAEKAREENQRGRKRGGGGQGGRGWREGKVTSSERAQEAGANAEGEVVRRGTSDELEVAVKRSVAATPNFFVDGLPLEPEAVNGTGDLLDSEGFQLVPPPLSPNSSLPTPFKPRLVCPPSPALIV